jgi:uncharacterized protein YifN (PemK superfamily)
MVKTRASIVVSPRAVGHPQLVTLVPLSNTAPEPIRAFHCEIPPMFLPKFMQSTGGARWAKCDMLYTMSLDRLELPQTSRDRKTGKRQYETPRLDLDHLRRVRACIAAALVLPDSGA